MLELGRLNYLRIFLVLLHHGTWHVLTGHGVDIFRDLLPATLDVVYGCLTAHLTIDTDISGNSLQLPSEGVELADHLINGNFHCQKFSLSMNLDCLAEVSTSNRLGDIGDSTDLLGQVGLRLVSLSTSEERSEKHTAMVFTLLVNSAHFLAFFLVLDMMCGKSISKYPSTFSTTA